jgi:hypothetical protein
VHYIEPQAGHPQQKAEKRPLIGQLSAQRGGALARDDLAVVEFRAL